MKPQFQHEANTSFALWIDHYLTCKGEGFSNKEGSLFYKEDEILENYPESPHGFICYHSEYKQWVANSDAESANIPDGVYIDTGDGGFNFCQRGHSGLMIDFDNGRILLSGMFFPDNYDRLKIKAEFAVKDINIYLSNQTEENLVLESKYNVNSRSTPEYGKDLGIPAYEQVAPAAFVSMERSHNEPFAFGGEDLTTLNYRVVFFAEDLYQLDGAMSLCTDAKNLGICNLSYEGHPFNEYGDLKNGSYSYGSTVRQFKKNGPIMFIEDTSASKIPDRFTKNVNPDLYLGFVDFAVSQARFPRL